MKATSLGKLLQQHNPILQKRAPDLYRSVVLNLCRVHKDKTWTRDIKACLKANDVRGLVEISDSLSSQSYDDATEHFVANQFAALIKKYPFPRSPFDPEATAIQKFLKSEHVCMRVNQRFLLRRKLKRVDDMTRILERARRWVHYVLGVNLPLEEALDECNFGPGASMGVHGNATNYSRKLLADNWTCTPSAFTYAYWGVMKNLSFRRVLNPVDGGFSSGDPDYLKERKLFSEKVRYCKHNKITFVPKTVKTHRSIAVEPLLNGYLQKGVDILMRKRLKRVGIDLSDQSLNQRMAREGSYDEADGFCTIDLSSASDSISIEIVRELLPPEWYDYLNAIRSKEYELKKEINIFNKFCSMGNGFCFPLETLIFASLCHAVGAGRPGRDFMVYGDDIIVRKEFFEPTVSVLRYCGFSKNTEKTFNSGPFRESCGEDFFNGSDVRPLVLDYALDSVQSIYKFLNIATHRSRTSLFFRDVRSYLINQIPLELRFIRPYPGPADTAITSLGDCHLTSPHCKWSKNHKRWVWKELIATPVSDEIWKRYGEGGISAYQYAVMSGSAASQAFSMRRMTRTKMRLVSHSGATCTWLPASSPDTVD